MPPARKTAAAKKTTTRTARPAAKKAAPPAKAAQPRKAAAAAAAKAVEQVAGDDQFSAFLTDLKDLVDKYLSPIGTTAPKKTSAKAAAAVEEETDEAGEATREEREEELRAMTVRALQNILIKHEYDESDVRPEKDMDVLITNILAEEFRDDEEDSEDEDEEDEEDEDEEDEEDEEEESEELDRDELLAYSLNELRKLAVSTYALDASDVKGKDKETIADLIMEAADAEDEDEEDEDGDEEEYYTEADLKPMPISEVRAIADEAGIRYTAAQGKSKNELIKLIVE